MDNGNDLPTRIPFLEISDEKHMILTNVDSGLSTGTKRLGSLATPDFTLTSQLTLTYI